MSVTEYANANGISRQAVLTKIANRKKRKVKNKLPEGVTCRKVGTQWVLKVKQ